MEVGIVGALVGAPWVLALERMGPRPGEEMDEDQAIITARAAIGDCGGTIAKRGGTIAVLTFRQLLGYHNKAFREMG